MKPSNLTTPRTLSECSFTIGYQTYSPLSDRPTFWEFVVYGTLGLAMMGGLLIAMLSYFDVLVQ